MRAPAAAAIITIISAAALASGLVASASPSPEPASLASEPEWKTHSSGMPLRRQWNSNYGYCGESSLIAAGLANGQYTSQWTARRLASPNKPQWRESSQLLLGVNDLRAAQKMRLAAETFPTQRPRDWQFLDWVKRHTLRGDQVIVGVFNNVTRLGENPSLADPLYDHITPVESISSRETTRRYDAFDRLTLSDNGLYTPRGPGSAPFLFTYEFQKFPKTRSEANAPDGPLYSLRERAPHYGLAISGARDPRGETIPVRLESSKIGEGIENKPILRHKPEPAPIKLTARVRIPDPSRSYRVLQYNEFDNVPVRGFWHHRARADRVYRIPAGAVEEPGDVWTKTIRARTSDTRVFRAVEAR